MAVMGIGIVRVPVLLGGVRMPVRVRLTGRIIGAMAVPVMLIVPVAVGVAERRVRVLVLMLLGQMEPHANAHEDARHHEPRIDRLA